MHYEVIRREKIATIWAGYGEINRLLVRTNDTTRTVVQKLIEPPRGRDKDEFHVRKLKSYRVEACFYAHLSEKLLHCKVPVALEVADNSLLLEDISIDYPYEDIDIGLSEAKIVVRWAAHFHASLWSSTRDASVPLVGFLDETGELEGNSSGVWEDGSYWCLKVRQKEYAALPDDRWRRIASTVDGLLADIPEHCKTIIHGDLKSANIAFHAPAHSQEIAVFDFQWSGKGVGVKDLAYFCASSVSGMTLEAEKELLDEYYTVLTTSLKASSLWTASLDQDLTRDNIGRWYALCLVDYYRFMLGWGTWGASLDYIKVRVDAIVREFDW